MVLVPKQAVPVRAAILGLMQQLMLNQHLMDVWAAAAAVQLLDSEAAVPGQLERSILRADLPIILLVTAAVAAVQALPEMVQILQVLLEVQAVHRMEVLVQLALLHLPDLLVLYRGAAAVAALQVEQAVLGAKVKSD